MIAPDAPTPDDHHVDGAEGSAPPKRHPIRRNALALLGGQAATWTMTLLWTVVVPRLLGPTGIGLITSVWAVAAILSIFLGLGSEKYLARELVGNPPNSGRLVGSALVLRLLMLPLFVSAAVVFAHYAHYGHDARLVLWLALGASAFTALDDPLCSAFTAFERMEYMAYSTVVDSSAQGLVGIAVVVAGFGVVGLTAAWLAVSIAVFLLGLYWVRPLVRVNLHTGLRQLADLSRASATFLATGVFFLIYLWIDSVMLSLMTSNKVVGWYAVPTKIFGALVIVPVVVATAWGPRFVQTFETSPDNLWDVARPPIELVLVFSLPVCAAAVLGARPFIPLVYGNAFRNSIPVMVIVGLTLVPMYANIIFAQILIAMRRQGRLTALLVGSAIVNPALNAIFIQLTQHRYHNGAIGAAICMLLTEMLVVGAEMVLVGRRLLRRSSFYRLLRATVAAGAMWGVGRVTEQWGWYLSLPLAAVTFLLLAWLLRLAGPEERAVIATTFNRLSLKVRRGRSSQARGVAP